MTDRHLRGTMAVSVYQQACDQLDSNASHEIETALTDSRSEPLPEEIRNNIRTETALAIERFKALLMSFAKQLAEGKGPLSAWKKACFAHQFEGREIPSEHCPSILGRVVGLDAHARHVSEANPGKLTEEQIKRHLLKLSGKTKLGIFEFLLRRAPLGRNVIWATFDSTRPNTDPFAQLPNSRDGICTALGLGHFTSSDTLLLLVWNHAESEARALHRPTVADAADSIWWRPRQEADALWGLTEPLTPNPGGLGGQPEVVMRVITGKSLQFPFRVIRT